MTWTLYEIECNIEGFIYVGITQQPEHRLSAHEKGNGASFTRKNGVRRSKILGTFETEKQAKLAEKLRAEELKRENPEYMIAGGPYASGPGFARLNPNSKGGTHKYRRYNKKRRLKASAPSLTL